MEKKMSSYNFQRAFVSPLESALAQDPHESNFKMFDAVDEKPFFMPAPVIDPLLANWKENLESLYDSHKMKMIRLFPKFHMYELSRELLGGIVEFTSSRNIIISIPLRLEDPRNQSPLFKEPMELASIEVANVLSCFPEQKFIINNVYWGEVLDMFYILDNALFDIAMIEPVNPLRAIKEHYSVDKFVFSSNCPLCYPEGNLNKLLYSDLEKEEIEKIAFRNIEELI
jgi:predicted TIM-barrel fold metal-dependent hydrolase